MSSSISLQNISKTFDKIIACKNIDLEINVGEVHSLVGENGAGKSTLVKIITGILKQDRGKLFIHGEEVQFNHPIEAIRKNIGYIPQEVLLVENKTGLENIILGNEPIKNSFPGTINKNDAEERINELINKYNISIDVNKLIEDMAVGEKQLIQLLRVLYLKSNIIILDEPTASLNTIEVEQLFKILNILKKSGSTIIFISHKIPEILNISDKITILRKGEIITTVSPDNIDHSSLASLISGNKIIGVDRKPLLNEYSQKILKIEKLEIITKTKRATNISFVINVGEIVGLLGIDGNGQAELESLIKCKVDNYSGNVKIDNKNVLFRPGINLKDYGIGYIPSHRESEGIISEFDIISNTMIGHQYSNQFQNKGFFYQSSIDSNANDIIEKYQVDPPDPHFKLSKMSGGNQQKIVLGRECFSELKILFAFNPTHGIDIKTSSYMHKVFNKIADTGVGILLVLNDIEESIKMCNRILVIYNGKISKEFIPENYDIGVISQYMMGRD